MAPSIRSQSGPVTKKEAWTLAHGEHEPVHGFAGSDGFQQKGAVSARVRWLVAHSASFPFLSMARCP